MFGLNSRRLFYIAVIAAVGYSASQYVPPYFDAIQFADFVRQEVKFAGPSRKTKDDVVANVVAKAREFNLGITPKDVRVTKRGPYMTLDVDYKRPIDMWIYKHDLRFHISESGEIFEK